MCFCFVQFYMKHRGILSLREATNSILISPIRTPSNEDYQRLLGNPPLQLRQGRSAQDDNYLDAFLFEARAPSTLISILVNTGKCQQTNDLYAFSNKDFI